MMRFEPVPPVRGGGEAEPSPRVRARLDAGLERHGGEVVALVDDDQAVAVEQSAGRRGGRGSGSSPRRRRRSACPCRRRSGRPGRARGRGARRVGPATGRRAPCGRRAPASGVSWWAMTAQAMTVLPAPGRGDEDAEVVGDERRRPRRLLRPQRRRRSVKLDRAGVRRGRRRRRAGCRGSASSSCDPFGEPAGKVEPLEVLAVAADEPGRVPGREPHPLLLVELRVGDRRRGASARRPQRAADPPARSTASRPSRARITGGGGGPPRRASSASVSAGPASTGRSDSASAADRVGCEPGDRRQERPLVRPRLHRRRVEEHRRAPCSRRSPWSGRAIRFPNEPFGMKSCDGKNRS